MAKTLGIALVAMLGGAAATYFLASPAAPAAAGTESEAEEIVEESPPDTVEVPIDTFDVSNRNASPGSVIHLRFKLVAAVPAGQEAALDTAVKTTMPGRIRQAVLKVARNASMEDIRDAEFSVMKRQMKEEVNKVLRKSLVSEVIVSEFRTMEQ